MNFPIRTYEGKCLVRPDITFNKNKEDYFIPDDVIALGWVPFAAARMSQAGKMIGARFAGRYWDAVGFGVLLYPAVEEKNGMPHFCRAAGSCFDRTTMLPLPLYNICTLENPDNRFSVEFGGEQIFNCSVDGIREMLQQAICECTLHSSVRRGDYLCRELASVRPLISKKGQVTDAERRLQLSYCGNITLDIGIV